MWNGTGTEILDPELFNNQNLFGDCLKIHVSFFVHDYKYYKISKEVLAQLISLQSWMLIMT